MSYIPPHKRHLKDPPRPSPVPDSIIAKFNRTVDLKKATEIVYSRDCIAKWFLIGSDETEDKVKLVPFSSDSSESINGENKPLVLLKNKFKESKEKSEWIMLVAEKVEDDLMLAIEKAKKHIKDYQHVDSTVLRLVARFGNFLFYRREAGDVSGFLLEKTSKRKFSTDVSTSFLQNINSKLVPNCKFCVDKEKETYIVKISHHTRPNEIVNCKCTLKEDGQINMYKTDMNPVRHLVADVSCIDKSIDMRLMLTSHRKLVALTEEEVSNINEILESATVDPNVKGGLRWSLGKASSKDGYSVDGFGRIKTTSYTNQTFRLRVREADRFDVKSGRGEAKWEVCLILKDINTQLQEDKIEMSCVLEKLRDALPTVWDFLSFDDA